VSVTERDFGWKRLMGQLKKAQQDPGVKVGVLSDAGKDDEGVDLLMIAAANEFGTGAIPSRPFVRGAFDAKQTELLQTQERLWNLVKAGRITLDQALGLLGEDHQGQIQEYMTALNTPPNAPRTIAQKGSSNPLISEGTLRRSIRWERD
jgi:hypothetical protein